MYYADFRKEGFSQNYISSRNQVDKLCDLMVLGIISPRAVLAEYDDIEAEFSSGEPEMAELFKMIYRNRVKRLAGQFPSEKL